MDVLWRISKKLFSRLDSSLSTLGSDVDRDINFAVQCYPFILEELGRREDLLSAFLRAGVGMGLLHMYGLVKTHKPVLLLRPTVSSINSCSYKLSKWIVTIDYTIVTTLLGMIDSSYLKHTYDMYDWESSSFNCSGKILVSFDVDSLFTKVPIDDLMDLLNGFLHNFNLSLPVNNFVNLIYACLSNCKSMRLKGFQSKYKGFYSALCNTFVQMHCQENFATI